MSTSNTVLWRRARAMAIVALGLVSFLAVGELALRMTGGADGRDDEDVPSAYFRNDPPTGLRYTAASDTELFFYGRSARVNADGYRLTTSGHVDDERPENAEWRVLCLGDSVTFGIANRDEETWPSQLEGLLQRCLPDGRSRCWNMGLPGFNTADTLATARAWIPRLRPHSVVYQFTDNDVDDAMRCSPTGHLVMAGVTPEFPEAYTFSAQPVVLRQQIGQAIKVTNEERMWPPPFLDTYEVVRLWQARRPGEVVFPHPYLTLGATPESHRRWRRVERALSDLRKACQQAGAELFVVHYGWRGMSEPTERRLRDICERRETPFETVAPYADFATHLRQFSTGLDEHPGVEGCRLIAERAANLLLDSDHATALSAQAPRGLMRYGAPPPSAEIATPEMSRRIELATLEGVDQVLGGVGLNQVLAYRSLFVLPSPGSAQHMLELDVSNNVPENFCKEARVDIMLSAGLRTVGHASVAVPRNARQRYHLVFHSTNIYPGGEPDEAVLAEPIWEIEITASPYWRPSDAEQQIGQWTRSIRFHALGWGE